MATVLNPTWPASSWWCHSRFLLCTHFSLVAKDSEKRGNCVKQISIYIFNQYVSRRRLWIWKQHEPLKCWYLTTTLHGVTTQKTSLGLKYNRRESLKTRIRMFLHPSARSSTGNQPGPYNFLAWKWNSILMRLVWTISSPQMSQWLSVRQYIHTSLWVTGECDMNLHAVLETNVNLALGRHLR